MATGTDALSYARSQLGDQYEFGATGPNEWDCSALMQWAYRQIGISIPRTTDQMLGPHSPLIPITREQLQPGDLVFSKWLPSQGHVGMYTGQGTIVEAANETRGVVETRLGPGYWAHTTAFRRPPGIDSAVGMPKPDDPDIPGAVLAGARAAGGIVGQLAGWIPNPKSTIDALDNIGSAMLGVAQSAGQVGQLAVLATRAFLPSNLLRGAAMMFGTIFVLIGIWFLAREIKETTV